MRVLSKVYKKFFFDAKNAAIAFSFLSVLLALFSTVYTSNVTFCMLALAACTIPLFFLATLRKVLLLIFIATSVIILCYFEPIWLDFVFSLNLVSLISCFFLSQDLLGEKLFDDNKREQQYLDEASLYKKRFDTIILEHQRAVKQKEIEGSELNDVISLQKERLEKLESLVKHQEVKCIEVSGHANQLSKKIHDIERKNDAFEKYCSLMAEKLNNKQTQEPLKKVPLVALRGKTKVKNKIQLTDLAKSFKR